MTLALVTGIVSSLAADNQAKADRRPRPRPGRRPRPKKADKAAKAAKPEKGPSRIKRSRPPAGKSGPARTRGWPQAAASRRGGSQARGTVTAKKRTVRRRRKTAPASVGLAPAGHRRRPGPRRRARWPATCEADGGAVLATYREPFGGTPVLFAALPVDRGRADAVPARSLAAARQAADGRDRDARPLPRSDHRRSVRTARTGRRTAITACRRCASSGRRPSTALLVPDPDVAFKILALNTEKAHNLKEKSLETIRMERALADERAARARERDFAFEFDQPSFLTLGAAYEKRPRLSGGAYHSMLRRIEDFLDEPLPRGARASASAARAGCSRSTTRSAAIVAKLKERGFDQPVSAAVRRRARQSDPLLDVDRVRFRRRARPHAEGGGEVQDRAGEAGGRGARRRGRGC